MEDNFLLKNKNSISIAEIGCGMSLLPYCIKNVVYPDVKVEYNSTDHHPTIIENVKQNLLARNTPLQTQTFRHNFSCQSWSALSKNQSLTDFYDLVICSDSIYKGVDIESLAAAIGNLMSKTGRAVVAVPKEKEELPQFERALDKYNVVVDNKQNLRRENLWAESKCNSCQEAKEGSDLVSQTLNEGLATLEYKIMILRDGG